MSTASARFPAINAPDSLGLRRSLTILGADEDIRTWGGRRGAKPENVVAVEFEQQLEKAVTWIENWDHKEICGVLQQLLTKAGHGETQLLWTILQPALHRDAMYSARGHNPQQAFTPISTFHSRKLKTRQILRREDTYHRIPSAYLQLPHQLPDVLPEVRLPDLPDQAHGNHENQHPGRHGDAQSGEKSIMKNPGRPTLKRSVTWSSFHPPCPKRSEEPEQPEKESTHVKSCNHGNSLDLSCSHGNIVDLSQASQTHRVANEESGGDVRQSHDGRLGNRQSSSLSLLSTIGLVDHRHKKKGPSKPGNALLDISRDGLQVLRWYLTCWNDIQRAEFLHKLLPKLTARQQYFISSLLVVQQYRDFVSHLPEKIAIKILAYLPPAQIKRSAKVCCRWRVLCNHNDLWRIKCSQLRTAIPVLSDDPNWKKLYYDHLKTLGNWNSGKCQVLDCKGHTDRVLSVTFDHHRMATGSVDKMIRVWDLDSGQCTRTLSGHLRGVWCLRFFSKHLLISGSYDCSIKVWNLKEGSCVRTLLGHEGSVWAIVHRGTRLASASQDRTARIWDAGRCCLLHVLRGHTGAVFCIDMDEAGSLVITGSSDQSVRVWDVTTGTQQRAIFVNDKTAVMSVSYSLGYFACSYGRIIAVYKLGDKKGSQKRLRTYREHIKRIEGIQLKMKQGDRVAGTIISGGKDGTLKYWDVSKEVSVRTFTGHRDVINCVHCDELRIGTASYDNKIKIWDFRAT